MLENERSICYIYFGNQLPKNIDDVFIYDTSTYFKNTYREKWITDELSKQMIKDVDHSTVISENAIDSPILGIIGPAQLSGGVKTLILINNDKKHVFNASNCGDNCAKWLLEIGKRHKKVMINLRHIMNFGNEPFEITILNNKKVVKNMEELLFLAGEYV